MDPQFWPDDNFSKPKDQEVAELVCDNRCKNQRQVFTLHGEKSKTKKRLDKYVGTDFNGPELYTKGCINITITGDMKKSYCLDGLNRNTVVFKRKVKHVMIRNCDDTRVYLNNGTIAGIDVLFGSNVSLRTPKHNYTNVEQSHNTKLNGTVDNNSLIHVTQSLDVFVNHKNLMVNPFHTKPLKMVYKNNNEHNRIDIGELSKSPTADSCKERWQTQLMLMGRDTNDSSDE